MFWVNNRNEKIDLKSSDRQGTGPQEAGTNICGVSHYGNEKNGSGTEIKNLFRNERNGNQKSKIVPQR